MRNNRKTLVIAACIVLGTAAGFFVLAWPEYRRAAATNTRVQAIRDRISRSAEETEVVRGLAQDLIDTRRRYENELKHIPAQPGMADLMTALSVPVDGVDVVDQTLTVGSGGPVAQVEDESLHALPLTIDMIATFDLVFDVLKTAEDMNRLVRVASVRIERDGERADLVSATIELEAIYEVPAKPTDEDEEK